MAERPEDIPEDVWATAAKWAHDLREWADHGNTMATYADHDEYAFTDTIARAILAAKLEEREACVKAATDEITLLLGDQFADTINGYVAATIRSRP